MGLLRLLLVSAYWLLLSVLLLAPDPAAILGYLHAPRVPTYGIGVHFTAFFTLSLLVCAARWPQRPGWLIVTLLVGYGLVIESLQALVPPRAVELLDYTENTLGVLAGAGIWWIVHRLIRGRPAEPVVAERPPDKAAAVH
jgi:VanZ family protein